MNFNDPGPQRKHTAAVRTTSLATSALTAACLLILTGCCATPSLPPKPEKVETPALTARPLPAWTGKTNRDVVKLLLEVRETAKASEIDKASAAKVCE